MVTRYKSGTTSGTTFAAETGKSYRIKRVMLYARNTAAEASTGVSLTFTPADTTYQTTWKIYCNIIPNAVNSNTVNVDNLNIVTWQKTAVSVGSLNGAPAELNYFIEYEEIAGVMQRND